MLLIYSQKKLFFLFSNEKRKKVSQFKIGQADYPASKAMVGFAQKERFKRDYSMRGKKKILLLPILLMIVSAMACAPSPKPSVLLRDLVNPPRVIQEIFAKEGKSDYLFLWDDGYSFRLIYLCENRIYNFVEEPANNPVLISIQPVLNTPVEEKLPADARRRIWACLERKVREEHSRIEEIKRRITDERIRLEKEVESARVERDQIVAAIEEKKKVEAERRRWIEEGMRRAEEGMRRIEEERLKKLEEEQQRKDEEERKIRAYKSGEKEKEKEEPPPPLPMVTESGIFLVMKGANIYAEMKITSKIRGSFKKYDIFEVINSKVDRTGVQWHQVIVHEKVISEKGKRIGWSPEEKPFWVKNKLLAWVYPGDLSKISIAKPLKFNPDQILFTGKKTSTPQKPILYEVIYDVNLESSEKIFGWIEEKSGIRRKDKNEEEMRSLLKELALTLWPIRTQNDVLAGYIRVGFTPEQVILSWGHPNHINKTRTLVGVHEQWVYGESPFPNSYVYFENKVVKNWEFLKKDFK
ncbi:MAG: hypothetical protein A2Z51_10355 [Deltaproteobacteria bacterium RBG_19FT_COMBO_52_11]|nr:MAG: hypothetical protein A2Z51_10355 [Deltaproteobacteria bacterium RBG_19FT_COMBO_52_11]